MTKGLHDCLHFSEFMTEQKSLMERHLTKHKFFQHIEDPGEAVIDFIQKYAWVIREVYCDLCSDNKECKIYKTQVTGYSV